MREQLTRGDVESKLLDLQRNPRAQIKWLNKLLGKQEGKDSAIFKRKSLFASERARKYAQERLGDLYFDQGDYGAADSCYFNIGNKDKIKKVADAILKKEKRDAPFEDLALMYYEAGDKKTLRKIGYHIISKILNPRKGFFKRIQDTIFIDEALDTAEFCFDEANVSSKDWLILGDTSVKAGYPNYSKEFYQKAGLKDREIEKRIDGLEDAKMQGLESTLKIIFISSIFIALVLFFGGLRITGAAINPRPLNVGGGIFILFAIAFGIFWLTLRKPKNNKV